MQIAQPLFERARVVERPAIQRMRHQDSSYTQATADVPMPALHQFRLRRTRRRNHRQRRAGPQSRRLHDCSSMRVVTGPATSPRQMISAGPVSSITASARRPHRALRATFRNRSQLARGPAQRHRRSRRSTRPRPRRSRRPTPALIDPKRNLVGDKHPHKLHIRPMRKQRTRTDLRAQAPAMRAHAR